VACAALNEKLRTNFSRVNAEKESLQGENERLSMELTDTSERLELYESVLLMDDETDSSGQHGSLHTVSNASMAEVRSVCLHGSPNSARLGPEHPRDDGYLRFQAGG
jgi:hypothetical protein